jgi:hypothetical protein
MLAWSSGQIPAALVLVGVAAYVVVHKEVTDRPRE